MSAFMEVKLILDAQCQLGEGICWDANIGRFVWVDIHGKRVWSYHLQTGTIQQWASPQRIGWLIRLAQSEQWVAGLQEGLAVVSLNNAPSLAVQQWLARPFEGRPGMRLNDAKADALGQIWAGSLNNDDESRPDGALFCLNTRGELVEVDTGYGVPNGPAIAPDGTWMLHTDSARRTIYAFDLDATGQASRKRIWKQLADGEGYPDGMTFDSEGCLWLAHWGASCVSRYNAQGHLLARVTLPTSHVTNLAFGGPALDRLFVTTARAGLSAAQLQAEPQAGAVFEVLGHGTKGLPPLPCRARL
jgi:D-xylonolactonase